MNREIKFRQAVMSFGKFSGWHYWGFIGGNFVCPVSEVDGMRLLPETAHKNSQEFTGLHDKSGKEIFEGDILRGKHHNHAVEWLPDVARFEGRAPHSFIPADSFEDYEVIGNIHENPELMGPGVK